MGAVPLRAAARRRVQPQSLFEQAPSSTHCGDIPPARSISITTVRLVRHIGVRELASALFASVLIAVLLGGCGEDDGGRSGAATVPSTQAGGDAGPTTTAATSTTLGEATSTTLAEGTQPGSSPTVPYCTRDDVHVDAEIEGPAIGSSGELVVAQIVLTHIGADDCAFSEEWSLRVEDSAGNEALTFGGHGACPEEGCILRPGTTIGPRFEWDRTTRRFNSAGDAEVIPAPPGQYHGILSIALGDADRGEVQPGEELPSMEAVHTFEFALVEAES